VGGRHRGGGSGGGWEVVIEPAPPHTTPPLTYPQLPTGEEADTLGVEGLVPYVASGDTVHLHKGIPALGSPVGFWLLGQILGDSRADGVDLLLTFLIGVLDLGEAALSGLEDCADVFCFGCVHWIPFGWVYCYQHYWRI